MTTTKTPRNPETIHPPLGAYSHHIEVSGSPRWLVMAGQVGRTPDGVVPDDPIEQLEVALGNVRRNLEAGGMTISDIVKVTWYLVGDIDPQHRRAVTGAWLNGHEPASTLVYVAALASPEFRVEVDAWACR
jgi:enamine deaminase RidA (YjgF/YER057c/UK114 family)